MKRSEPEKKEMVVSLLLNISALCYFSFILLGIIVPLGVWIFTKDRYTVADEVGRRLLNFQLCWCLLVFYSFAMMFLIPSFSVDGALVISFLYVVNACFILLNSVRCYLGKEMFYPALRFIK
jgi:uncharacterized Tic20 family protein